MMRSKPHPIKVLSHFSLTLILTLTHFPSAEGDADHFSSRNKWRRPLVTTGEHEIPFSGTSKHETTVECPCSRQRPKASAPAQVVTRELRSSIPFSQSTSASSPKMRLRLATSVFVAVFSQTGLWCGTQRSASHPSAEPSPHPPY
ncbi:hypothetical protein B0J13DRAFT_263304 [Dactylonectria estremocensis]|uniref:Secreted protein n=1 Tax=Dactylonectria estremocensis TaxID=1079267 RepID=A0A9P9F3Z5_9HYPO|nr:hypothetical protein B0J13DRAFT_263304 [Dactylonectria estremocensis]